MQQIERFRAIKEEPSLMPYTTAKAELLDVYGETLKKKVRRFVESNAATMVNIKPSPILDKIKALCGNMVNEPLFKEFWLERIPPETRLLILSCMNPPLEDLAKQADSLSELLIKNKTNFSTAVVNLPSLESPINQLPSSVPSVQPSSSISALIESAILLCMQEMTKNENAFKVTYRDFNYDRSNRSRTRGRRDLTPAAKRNPEFYNGLCWYHHNFGDRCYRCKVGCREYTKALYGNKLEN